MIFVISEEAAEDLENFGDRAARSDPSVAVAVMKELLRYCRAIALAPNAWEQVPDLGEGLRCATYDRWAIYYSAHENEIRIERLFPHRRRRAIEGIQPCDDDMETG